VHAIDDKTNPFFFNTKVTVMVTAPSCVQAGQHACRCATLVATGGHEAALCGSAACSTSGSWTSSATRRAPWSCTSRKAGGLQGVAGSLVQLAPAAAGLQQAADAAALAPAPRQRLLERAQRMASLMS